MDWIDLIHDFLSQTGVWERGITIWQKLRIYRKEENNRFILSQTGVWERGKERAKANLAEVEMILEGRK